MNLSSILSFYYVFTRFVYLPLQKLFWWWSRLVRLKLPYPLSVPCLPCTAIHKDATSCQLNLSIIFQVSHDKNGGRDLNYQSSFFKQLFILCLRTLRNIVRDPRGIIGQFGITLIMALIVGGKFRIIWDAIKVDTKVKTLSQVFVTARMKKSPLKVHTDNETKLKEIDNIQRGTGYPVIHKTRLR